MDAHSSEVATFAAPSAPVFTMTQELPKAPIPSKNSPLAVERRAAESIATLESAYQAGDAKAAYQLAQIKYRQGHNEEADMMMDYAARHGYAPAAAARSR